MVFLLFLLVISHRMSDLLNRDELDTDRKVPGDLSVWSFI